MKYRLLGTSAGETLKQLPYCQAMRSSGARFLVLGFPVTLMFAATLTHSKCLMNEKTIKINNKVQNFQNENLLGWRTKPILTTHT